MPHVSTHGVCARIPIASHAVQPGQNSGPRDPDRRGCPFGAPVCRMYEPAPGLGARTRGSWLLEFEPVSPQATEPLIGWTASGGPSAQIRLKFPDLASAVANAERQGLDYCVIDLPAQPRFRTNKRVRELGRGSQQLPRSGCLELMTNSDKRRCNHG
jgi:hypothetical protein